MKTITKVFITVIALALSGCYPYENSHSNNDGYYSNSSNSQEKHHGQDTQIKDHRDSNSGSGQYHQDGRH